MVNFSCFCYLCVNIFSVEDSVVEGAGGSWDLLTDSSRWGNQNTDKYLVMERDRDEIFATN